MKKVIAKIDFTTTDGKMYIKGDEIKVNNINVIKKLNENGFIEPLEYKDLVLIERELNKNNIDYKEE